MFEVFHDRITKNKANELKKVWDDKPEASSWTVGLKHEYRVLGCVRSVHYCVTAFVTIACVLALAEYSPWRREALPISLSRSTVGVRGLPVGFQEDIWQCRSRQAGPGLWVHAIPSTRTTLHHHLPSPASAHVLSPISNEQLKHYCSEMSASYSRLSRVSIYIPSMPWNFLFVLGKA